MRNEKQICCEFRYFHHVPPATDPQVAGSPWRGGGRVTKTGLMAECLLYSVQVSHLPSLCIHLYPPEQPPISRSIFACMVPCPALSWLW